jgi:hypothetical protein
MLLSKSLSSLGLDFRVLTHSSVLVSNQKLALTSANFHRDGINRRSRFFR